MQPRIDWAIESAKGLKIPVSEISKRSLVSRVTVDNVIKGNPARPLFNEAIANAVHSILLEKQKILHEYLTQLDRNEVQS